MDKDYQLSLNGLVIQARGTDPANIVRIKPDGVEERYYFSVGAMFEILSASQLGRRSRYKRKKRKTTGSKT
jgi:hypothetical protein